MKAGEVGVAPDDEVAVGTRPGSSRARCPCPGPGAARAGPRRPRRPSRPAAVAIAAVSSVEPSSSTISSSTRRRPSASGAMHSRTTASQIGPTVAASSRAGRQTEIAQARPASAGPARPGRAAQGATARTASGRGHPPYVLGPVRALRRLNASPDSLNRNPSSARRTTAGAGPTGWWPRACGASTSAARARPSPRPGTPTRSGPAWPRSSRSSPARHAAERRHLAPEIARRALDAGATLAQRRRRAAERGDVGGRGRGRLPGGPAVPVSGPDPLHMEIVADHDPWPSSSTSSTRLRRADRYGIRDHVVLDPGTGFAPHDWPWEERFVYQKPSTPSSTGSGSSTCRSTSPCRGRTRPSTPS